jgi:hypothetical protein
MHPDLMLELARQRTSERQEAARHASLARALRKARRAQRARAEAPDTFVAPPIPDYVDGTFRGAETKVAGDHASAGR